MTDRITEQQLKLLVAQINKATNSPETSYTRMKNGKLRANIGNYHLDFSYGGVELQRMSTEGGGIQVISRAGHSTKRALYDFMTAFLAGHSQIEAVPMYKAGI